MEADSFDALTRRFSRAASEAAGLTVAANSVRADGRKRKGKNNKGKGDVNTLQRCKEQAADWATLVAFSCGDDLECQETFLPCAEPLETCDFNGFLQCFIDVQST